MIHLVQIDFCFFILMPKMDYFVPK